MAALKDTEQRYRRTKWLAAAAAVVPLVALPAVGGAVPVSSAADFDYFPPGPTRVLTLSLLPGGNDDDLQGVVCQSPRACESVKYSYLFKSTGVANLDNALRDGTSNQQIVFAYSQGARVAAFWIEEHAGTEGAPPASELSFVLMGNPGRKYGGADNDWDNVVPDSEYKVIDVSRQYDPASDFPDNPFNLLALANAMAGLMSIHQDYEEVDIYDPANYVWTEGNTTYVFVPTQNLPLLQPLRWFGLSALADSLNGPLKEKIESAYDRSYLPAEPGLPPGEPDPEPEPEPEEPPAEPEEPPTDPLPDETAAAIAPEAAVSMVSGTMSDDVASGTIQPVDTDGQSESIDADGDSDTREIADEIGDDVADDIGDGTENDEGAEDDTEAESESNDNTSAVTSTSTLSREGDSGPQASRQATSPTEGAD